MKKNNQDDPVTGVFIFGKDIKNDGQIISEGARPVTHIQTDRYRGKGTIRSNQVEHVSGRWHNTWWGVILIGLCVTVLGGVIVFLLTK